MIDPGKATIAYLHPGDVRALFSESLMRLMFHDIYGANRVISHGHGVIGKRCSASDIDGGRNNAARQFLDDGEGDWLLFIDSDMGFAPTLLEELIAAAHPTRRPIVGGLCFAVKRDGSSEFGGVKFRCEPTLYMAPDLRVADEYPTNKLVRVGATGAACLLIHRNALVKIRDEFGDHWFDCIPLDQLGKFSEDLSFCIRADKLDIPLYVHTGIKTTHDKGFVCFDESYYLAQQAAREATA